jgi:hypothetical protein
LFPLFATGVIVTGAKFAAGVVDTGGNLPPASLTLVVKYAAGVVDTGGKFATGSLISVVHLDFSAKFSKKFEMTLVLFIGASGNMIHGKNLKQKIL